MRLQDLYRRTQVYNFRGEKSRPLDSESNLWDVTAYAKNDIVEPKVNTIQQEKSPLHKSNDLGNEDHYEISDKDDDKTLETQRNNARQSKEVEEPELRHAELGQPNSPKSLSHLYRTGNQTTPPTRPRHRKFMGYPPNTY